MGERNWTRFFRKVSTKKLKKLQGHDSNHHIAQPPKPQLVGMVYRHWGANPDGVGKSVANFVATNHDVNDPELLMKKYVEMLAAAGKDYDVVEDISEETLEAERLSNNIFIEYVVDVEVCEDEETMITLIPGAACMDDPELWDVRGNAEEVLAWIDNRHLETPDTVASKKKKEQYIIYNSIQLLAEAMGVRLVNAESMLGLTEDDVKNQDNEHGEHEEADTSTEAAAAL